MGQSQSAPAPQRATTPEPDIDPEERARRQEEDRARRAAAVEQRLAAMQKRSGAKASSTPANGNGEKKKLSALEEMSRENRGWRDADAAADMRAYN
ncbi:hypothetical protein CC78DRAFT_587422 [Lojkania enalia]|uniref:Uncharacterized protein n=1 Tax=Lojkania enalia TaxID=147567 RepID=A0A9P4JX29_9PLEO|nr:hypothetical protein CC78DRAFT_587422 [Didymosphaeria enalia]